MDNQQIFYNRKYVILGIVGLAVLSVFHFFLAYISGTNMLYAVLMAVLCILMIVRYNSIYAIVTERYLSIKPAPARSRIMIDFDDITQIEKQKNKLIIHTNQAGVAKKTVVYFSGLEQQDQQRFFNALNPLLEKYAV